MKNLIDIIASLLNAAVDAMLWAEADVDMERVPCRVNDVEW